MVYAPHVKVSFGGALDPGGTAQEIWNCNVNVVRPPDGGGASPIGVPTGYVPTGGGSDDFDAVAYMESIAPVLASWYTAPANGMSNNTTLTFLKVNAVGPDGNYVNKFDTNVHDYVTMVLGGASPTVPDILSLATSWTTGKRRGPGSHGRIYLPNNTWGSGTAMRVGGGPVASAAAAGRRLLLLLADVANTKGRVLPCVSSKVDATNTTILGVRVGDVLDVQRRRKDALKETYTSLAV